MTTKPTVKKTTVVASPPILVQNIVDPKSNSARIITCPRCKSTKMVTVRLEEWKCADCSHNLARGW